VVGFDWTMLAQGSTATLKIAQTMKIPVPSLVRSTNAVQNTPYPSAFFLAAPVISTSSAINIPVGLVVGHIFRAQVSNPVFILSNLNAAATYTLTVNYGIPRNP
jgi:hypothetical protein